ncbi:hypothetical protein P153DRAFT_259480, partial [Dothidotthia symphoricarpi CBS 119687]
MAPNLFVVTQTLFSPQKWFRTSKSERSARKTEYWENGPVPGLYEYIPGRGWYLIATLRDVPTEMASPKIAEGGPVQPAVVSQTKEYVKLDRPIQTHWSRVLKRYLLESEYKVRKANGIIQNSRGKNIDVGFFRLDDGVAWVHCWDEHGEFISGPYKLWCIDTATNQFRHMRKGDDPKFIKSRSNSRERDADSQSQDSRSTQFRSGPGGTPSMPGSRSNSIMMSPSTSASASRNNSRRNSLRRNDSIPFEEARVKLRRMAMDQEEAVRAAAQGRL